MANTLAQNPSYATFSGASSVNVAFASGGTNPSLYIACVTCEDGSLTITVSDNRNAGNYSQDSIGSTGGTGVGAGSSSIYSKQNTSTSVATITASLSGSTYGTLKTFELTGAATSSALDSQVASNGSSSPRTVTLNTGTANCSVFACATYYPNGATNDTGFTAAFSEIALFFSYQVCEYDIDVGASGNPGALNFADSSGKGNWSMAAAAYKTDAGGGGVSGTLATTNANDTMSASGTTTVTGTLARTNTNDTMSASGSPRNTGSSAATGQNDTMSASGTTTIQGTMAATNAGDTMAASGAPGDAVAGTMAATNQGDSMSAAGTTTVRGTMAAQAGNDTMGAAGTPSVNGAMAATNQNDTMSASGTSGTPVAGGKLRPMVGFGQ